MELELHPNTISKAQIILYQRIIRFFILFIISTYLTRYQFYDNVENMLYKVKYSILMSLQGTLEETSNMELTHIP